MSDDHFDWLDDSGIVIHEQPAIAVHRNQCGQLAIRQRDVYDENDTVIFLNLESAAILAEAIVKAASKPASVMTDSIVTVTDSATLHVFDGGQKGSG